MIRKARPSDYKKIMKLFNSLSNEDKKFIMYDFKKERLISDISNGVDTYIDVENNGDISAYIHNSTYNNKPLLDILVIDSKYRGMGKSKELLDFYNNTYGAHYLKSNPNNKKMIDIVQSYGYKVHTSNDFVITWEK